MQHPCLGHSQAWAFLSTPPQSCSSPHAICPTSPSKTLLHSLPLLLSLSQVRMTSNSPIEVTSDGLMTKSSSRFSDLCSLDSDTPHTHLDFRDAGLPGVPALPQASSSTALFPISACFLDVKRLRHALEPLFFFLTMLFLRIWLV